VRERRDLFLTQLAGNLDHCDETSTHLTGETACASQQPLF
jgi:hypothetical protein